MGEFIYLSDSRRGALGEVGVEANGSVITIVLLRLYYCSLLS